MHALFWGYVCPFADRSAEAMDDRQRLTLTLRNLELDLCPWVGPLYSGLMSDPDGKQLTARSAKAHALCTASPWLPYLPCLSCLS